MKARRKKPGLEKTNVIVRSGRYRWQHGVVTGSMNRRRVKVVLECGRTIAISPTYLDSR